MRFNDYVNNQRCCSAINFCAHFADLTDNITLCYYFSMIKIEDIQKRLREEIKSSDISQKELAKRLGINPSTVSKYLRLDKFPSLETFANICEILDVSADEILGLKK